MLSYDFSSDRITGGRLGEKDAAEIEISPEIEQRWRVEEDFIAAVRSPGSIQPQPSFALGVQYMRVVQAVADSVASGSEVQIAANPQKYTIASTERSCICGVQSLHR